MIYLLSYQNFHLKMQTLHCAQSPPTLLGPCLVPPSLAQAKKAMKPLKDSAHPSTEDINKGTMIVGWVI